ncbi:MAG: hypothetical protein HQ478_08535 [Chloroflexi bacterium]|nr:hypothetical protein [Chloroflexota bacterium]
MIGDELADVFAASIRIPDHYGIDLSVAHMRARDAEEASLLDLEGNWADAARMMVFVNIDTNKPTAREFSTVRIVGTGLKVVLSALQRIRPPE